MSPARTPAKRILRLVTLLAMLWALLPGTALANGGTCRKWPEDRLAISPNLKARHFVLEPLDGVQQLPPFLEPGARRVFHRPFSLSLDAAEPIGIYRTSSRRICVIARESDAAKPLTVPVFYIGRGGQPAPELREDAERAAFSRTSSLTDVENFTDVRFHLKKGGFAFPDIEPFFACGLPGVVLCEGSCPTDLLPLAETLLDWVLRGESWPLEVPDSSGLTPKARPAPSADAGASPKGGRRVPDIVPRRRRPLPSAPRPRRLPLRQSPRIARRLRPQHLPWRRRGRRWLRLPRPEPAPSRRWLRLPRKIRPRACRLLRHWRKSR